MIPLVYARFTGLLKSDLATIEIELNAAVRALDRGDAAQASAAIAEACRCAIEGQQREAEFDATVECDE
jgi:hypothetical protein